MPFNGSGVFNRLYSWVQDAINGIKIRADRMDNEMNGMATGLTDCVTRDGQSPALADLPMAGFRHTGVGDANADDQYASLGQTKALLPVYVLGYYFGFELSAAGGSASFGVAAGVATDNTNVLIMRKTGALVKTTSAWVAGNGGALDTGTIAINTPYHIHEISAADGSAVDTIASLSLAAPTLPSGYTLFRRIGTLWTDGSSQWVAMSQIKNRVLWTAAVGSVVNFDPTIGVAGFFSVQTPPGVRTIARLKGVIGTGSGAVNATINIYSPSQSDQNNAPNGNSTGRTPVANAISQYIVDVLTNTNSQVRYQTAGSIPSDCRTNISTYGYDEFF